MYTVGIDPGKDGGVTVLDERGKIVLCEIMPKTANRICSAGILQLFGNIEREFGEPQACWIEKVGSRPGNAAAAMFSFGQGYGFLIMGMVAMGWRYYMVTPGQWMRSMHAGVGAKNLPTTKHRSHAAAMQLWPQMSFIPEGRRKPHDGLFESALIAEYGRCQNT